MSDIDKKLKAIILDGVYDKGSYDREGIDPESVDSVIPDIKQAFADAGYVKPEDSIIINAPTLPKLEFVTSDNNGATSVTLNGTTWASGQEWYDRFEPEILAHGFYEEVSRQFVLQAAKRAAGISE